jgi:hypothetical protein
MNNKELHALRVVLEYLWEDERKNYEFDGKPYDHIFTYLLPLREYAEKYFPHVSCVP